MKTKNVDVLVEEMTPYYLYPVCRRVKIPLKRWKEMVLAEKERIKDLHNAGIA